MLLSPFLVVTVDLANIAIHLSRLQGGTAFPAAHGGQVMASVSPLVDLSDRADNIAGSGGVWKLWKTCASESERAPCKNWDLHPPIGAAEGFSRPSLGPTRRVTSLIDLEASLPTPLRSCYAGFEWVVMRQ